MTQIPAGTKFVGISSTVPTPENRSSQNNAFQEVYTIEDILSSAYTETIVNISSAKILAMGSSPIELLPAAGVGNYYEGYALFEYNYGTSGYTSAPIYITWNNAYMVVPTIDSISNDFIFQVDTKAMFSDLFDDSGTKYSMIIGQELNEGMTISTWDGSNPTIGDGTLLVKIYHKTIKFGA
jgi:hypothetical protein